MSSQIKRFLPWLLVPFLSGTVLATSFFHGADALEELGLAYDQSSRDSKAAYFHGYVIGVADSTQGTVWCPSGKPNREEVTRNVSRYIKAHRDMAGQGAMDVVKAALAASYACKKDES